MSGRDALHDVDDRIRGQLFGIAHHRVASIMPSTRWVARFEGESESYEKMVLRPNEHGCISGDGDASRHGQCQSHKNSRGETI